MRTLRIEAIVQAGLFALFLTLPLLDTACQWDPYKRSAYEKPVERPDAPTTLKELDAYADLFEAHHRRHFGWRDWLARGFHVTSYRLFGFAEVWGAITGRDGWVYFGGLALDYQRANRPFTYQELRRHARAIEERQRWLARRGIRYLYLVAPNKHSIYPEHLPSKALRVGEETRYRQLAAYLEKRTQVPVLDLHAVLLAAKERERIYERTGSHWNQRGAYLAYREILVRLQAWFPDLDPVLWDDVLFEREGGPDLLRSLGLEDVLPEERLAIAGGLSHFGHEFRRRGSVETDVPDASLPRAVIFHDSFGSYLQPFLSEHFEHAAYFWHSDFDGQLVLDHGADLVIEERVERTLMRRAGRNSFPGQ